MKAWTLSLMELICELRYINSSISTFTHWNTYNTWVSHVNEQQHLDILSEMCFYSTCLKATKQKGPTKWNINWRNCCESVITPTSCKDETESKGLFNKHITCFSANVMGPTSSRRTQNTHRKPSRRKCRLHTEGMEPDGWFWKYLII